VAPKEYFRLRYRRSLIAVAIVWGLASPVIIFGEWWVARSYQQYVERVTHPPAADLVDFTGRELPPGARVGSPPSGPAKDAVLPEDWRRRPHASSAFPKARKARRKIRPPLATPRLKLRCCRTTECQGRQRMQRIFWRVANQLGSKILTPRIRITPHST
jgi:hypothetical protein